MTEVGWADDDAAEAAGMLVGAKVTGVESVPCSAGNQAFVLQVDGARLVMKTASAQAVRAEAAVLALLARHDVPVPEVVASDADGIVGGRPTLVVGHVVGEVLDGPSPVLAEVGSLLHRVHEIEVDGFGSIDVSADGLHGTHTTWASALEERAGGITHAVAAGKVAPELAERAMAAIKIVIDLGCGPARLLHGDLHPRHVFARDGRVTAIIDWGDATAGDPVYDLARVLHSGALGASLERGCAQLAALRDGWAPDEALSEADRRRLLAYAVAFVGWVMLAELRGGSPWPLWWDLQVESLAAILDALDG